MLDMDAKKVAELKKIVLAHKGRVVESDEEASHLVEWDEEVDGKNRHMGELIRDPNEEDYIRTLELQPYRIRDDANNTGVGLVHWWYHPDSYDEYIPLKGEDIQFTDPPDTHIMPVGKKWRVCCKFISDVAIFNEWGNPLDYEIEKGGDVFLEPELDISSSGSKRLKKKQAAKQSEVAQEYVAGTLLFTEKMNQNCVPITENTSVECVKVVEVESNLNENGKQSNKYSYKFIKPKGSSDRKRNQSNEDNHQSFDSHSCQPEWFSISTIHVNEIEAMSEFFDKMCSLRTPASYMRIRNMIYEMYRNNPCVYLSATEARRKMSGDVCTILRVHDYMDAYGIINYAVLSSRPFPTYYKPEIIVPSQLVPENKKIDFSGNNVDKPIHLKSLYDLTSSDLFMSGTEMQQRLSSKFSDKLLTAVSVLKKRDREETHNNDDVPVDEKPKEINAANIDMDLIRASTSTILHRIHALKDRIDLVDKIENDLEADTVSVRMEGCDLMHQQIKLNRDL